MQQNKKYQKKLKLYKLFEGKTRKLLKHLYENMSCFYLDFFKKRKIKKNKIKELEKAFNGFTLAKSTFE